MASIRGKTQMPVGSAQWVSNEREQVAQFEDEQIEDFAFAVRNDLDWLNEHMAEIFSENQLNVTEIFKTPGKLRGKTPRTARKRNPLEARAPLTDVFATDLRFNKSPARPIERFEDIAKARASPARVLFAAPTSSRNSLEKQVKQPTDSGYHGLAEDEMDTQEDASPDPLAEENDENEPPQQDSAVDVDMETEQLSQEALTAETSFHSARENNTTRGVGAGIETQVDRSDIKVADAYPVNPAPPPKTSAQNTVDEMDTDKAPEQIEASQEPELEPELDASPSSSDASSPEKPPMRKSSLNFASLPAREPLATKRSFGNRVSRTSQLETAMNTAKNQGSYFGRFTGGKSLGASRPVEDEDEIDMDDESRPALERDESDGDGKLAQMHSKSSTQRLHERINLLGKTQQPPRPTKSIPAATALPAFSMHQEPEPFVVGSEYAQGTSETETPETAQVEGRASENDDDDWIAAPTNKAERPERPQLIKSRSIDVMEQVVGADSIGGAQLGMGLDERENAMVKSPSNLRPSLLQHELKKSMSTTMLPSPSRPMLAQQPVHAKATSVSHPARNNDSTTPPGSPAKPGGIEGHLSASKSKLQSIMKSARGLFTSSAGASAQAKMETLSPNSLKTRWQEQRNLGGIDEVLAGNAAMSNHLYPKLPQQNEAPLAPSPGKERKTRSSTEKEERRKEQEAKDRQQVEEELEEAREQDRHNTIKQKDQTKTTTAKAPNKLVEDVASLENTSKPMRQSPRRLAKEEAEKASHQMPPPSRPGTAASQTQPRKEIRRPVKPAKEPLTRPRAPPVAIRVGTMSQRVNSNLSSVTDTGASSQPLQRPAGPTKKGSNASIQTSASNSSFKSSTSSVTSKPKALIAAERKREQDEREAQRKAEQKREMERKRAAAQEEAQRREQKARDEAEKLREKERALAAEQEAKKIAHKQAVEKRRLEMMKKDEQQRQQAQRAATELSQALEAEKLQSASSRADLGSSKPQSRMEKIQEFPRPPGALPQVNPAKPPIKRVFDPDNDDEWTRPSRPQPGQNWQGAEGKRRKTEDEDDFIEKPVRPAMAPPIRQSNIRKFPNTGYSQGPKASMSGANYSAAPPTAYSQPPGQPAFKPSSSQSYQQYNYGNPHAQPTRAGNPMEMAKYTSGKIPFADAPNPPGSSAAPYKTPLQSHKLPPPSTSKSSPHFINGEHIHLDDIPTDSDEEDSEDERDKKSSMPDWVRTPNLFRNLSDQEGLNPDAVFGPIAPLNMEEMFKDKSRHKKFRDRTSSANWFADRVTDDEVKRDIAARDRMRKDGGWSYGL